MNMKVKSSNEINVITLNLIFVLIFPEIAVAIYIYDHFQFSLFK